jgi:hypothetical protein
MFSRRSIAAIALGIGFALAFTSAALGATGSSTYASPGEHAFVVPAGVKRVQVRLIGGRGGAGDSMANDAGASVPGGAPSTVTAVLAVTPGERLYAEVGGNGGPGDPNASVTAGSAPGINGGGAGGEIFPFPCLFFCESIASGGGGGGASDIRTCAEAAAGCNSLLSRLVVAGGGGGGGGSSALGSGGPGGNGDAAGIIGQPDGHGDAGGGGGGRGTPTAPGAVGHGNGGFAGTLGVGGSGQATFGASPGGGGGGLYGGGSGGEGGASSPNQTTLYAAGSGGGGGGSSGVPSAAKGVSDYQFVPTATGAQPLIRFTWVLPRPTVATGAARRLTRTAAVLTGLLDPNGYPVSACHFLLSPGGRSVPCSQHLGAGAKAVGVSARVAGLAPGTGYRFRLAAASANGVATGSTVRFRTLH